MKHFLDNYYTPDLLLKCPNESCHRTGHRGKNPAESLLREVEEALPAQAGETLKIRAVPLLGGELANLPVASMNVFLLVKRTSL